MNRICLLILAGFFFMNACSQTEKQKPGPDQINPDVVNNPATAAEDNQSNKDNLPVFEFNEENHDFGTLKQGESVSHDFKFKNTGKGDLVIRSAHGSCGCTVPEYSKEAIAPGKEGVIKVTFNSEGKEGKMNKTVTILANTVPNTKVLTITCDVKK